MFLKQSRKLFNNPISRSIIRTQSTSSSFKEKDTDHEVRTIGKKSEMIFSREHKYGAHDYHPIPVAIAKAKGNFLINYLTIKN